MNIKTRLILLTGITVFGLSGVAQEKTTQGVIQDKTGKIYRITGVGHFLLSRQPGKKLKINIDGTPVVASWMAQGLELTAKGLELMATEDYKLLSAALTGGIVFTAKESGDVMTVEAPGANYTEADQKLTVTGALTLDRKSAEGDRVYASGSGGTVFLDRNSTKDDLIKSAKLSGPVVFKLTGFRLDEETKKKMPYSVNASASSLTYSDSERQAILEGNVKIDGNDPTLFGSMSNVDRVVIKLSATREIDSIEMSGNPATTTFEQKTKTTGGGGAGGRRPK